MGKKGKMTKDNIEILFDEIMALKHDLKACREEKERSKLIHKGIDLNNRYYHLTKEIIHLDYAQQELHQRR